MFYYCHNCVRDGRNRYHLEMSQVLLKYLIVQPVDFLLHLVVNQTCILSLALFFLNHLVESMLEMWKMQLSGTKVLFPFLLFILGYCRHMAL